MDNNGRFDDAVAGVVDYHVSEAELWSRFRLLCQLCGKVQPVGVVSDGTEHVVVDVAGELDGFTQPVHTLDDSVDEFHCELGGIW